MLLLIILLIGAVSSFSSGSVLDKHGIEKIGTHNLTGNQYVTMAEVVAMFDDFSNRQTVAYDSLRKNIDEVDQSQKLTETAMKKQLEKYEIENNMKIDGLLQRDPQINEKVGLTTCVSVDGFVDDHTLIRMDEVRTHVGIVDLAAVRNGGRFTCEKDGLYQISVIMNSPTSNAQFSVKVNGNTVSTLRLSSDNNINSATSVVAADLQTGDIVWAQAESRFHVYFHWSCMTVVKVN